MGYKEYSYQYRDYAFHFSNQLNQILFMQNPERYIPAWGGFCSKGISDEHLPDYLWSASCLGPSPLLNAYEIIDDRLHVFLNDTAKGSFLEDTKENIKKGDLRWSEFMEEGPVLLEIPIQL